MSAQILCPGIQPKRRETCLLHDTSALEGLKGGSRTQSPTFHTHRLAGMGWKPWILAVWGLAGSPVSPGPQGLRWGLGMTPESSVWEGWESGSQQVEDSPQPQPETPQPHSCRMHQGCGQAPLLRATPVPLEEARTVLKGTGRSTLSYKGWGDLRSQKGTKFHSGRLS